jgi:hypothetical protein
MPVTNIGDDGPDGMQIGARSSTAAVPSKVALYGATPVAQRAASIQATSFLSASSNVTIGATLTAWALEVTNTLIGLGIWKGAA